jgi:hypothetical protein
MTVRALLPDGTKRLLLHIPQWNFQWQQDYRFVTPIALSRGTTISLEYSYDNAEDNKSNPHRPVRRVTWGPQSSDEMGNLGVQLLPRSTADAAVLVKSFADHAALIDPPPRTRVRSRPSLDERPQLSRWCAFGAGPRGGGTCPLPACISAGAAG